MGQETKTTQMSDQIRNILTICRERGLAVQKGLKLYPETTVKSILKEPIPSAEDMMIKRS